MVDEPRMTIPTQLVLQALLADPDHELYGVQVGARAGLRRGTVHPVLARLEGVGWSHSQREDVDPRTEGRPARRCHPLTAAGARAARAALARAHEASPAWRLRPQVGGT